MLRILVLAKNKFFIAGVAFITWMFFFDRYDFSTQYRFQQEKSRLEYEKNFYVSAIDSIEKSIHDVQYNHSEIQRIAREKYRMKRNNEDVYVIMEVEPKN